MEKIEIWRPVPEFDAYEISNLARVRSVRSGYGVRARPLMMSILLEEDGRKNIHLRRGGRQHHKYIAALMLEAFVGPRPDGMEGCHNDGNPANDSLDNLRWDTRKSNTADSLLHGTYNRQILTADDVRCIRAEPHYDGVGMMLARAFGVDKHTIYNIRLGRTWTIVPQYL